MTQDDINRFNAQIQNMIDVNYTLSNKVLSLEAENQQLRDMVLGMREVCANAIKQVCLSAVQALPLLPPPRMPSAAHLSVVHNREAS